MEVAEQPDLAAASQGCDPEIAAGHECRRNKITSYLIIYIHVTAKLMDVAAVFIILLTLCLSVDF